MFEIFNMCTITLNGNSSELSCDIFPALEFDRTAQICLLSLMTNNSIPNIEPGCNTIRFIDNTGKYFDVIIPTGTYEINSLELIIQKLLPKEVLKFQLKADNSTLKCLMMSSFKIDFTHENNISSLLGFESTVYEANHVHESIKLVNILKINCIKVECNLISGSFCDGEPSQAIHEFFPNVAPGYKIIEVPRHLVFYPLHSKTVSKVNIVLKDQNKNLVNLQGEPITVRLQIRSNYGS